MFKVVLRTLPAGQYPVVWTAPFPSDFKEKELDKGFLLTAYCTPGTFSPPLFRLIFTKDLNG